jgi:hypothetical protein
MANKETPSSEDHLTHVFPCKTREAEVKTPVHSKNDKAFVLTRVFLKKLNSGELYRIGYELEYQPAGRAHYWVTSYNQERDSASLTAYFGKIETARALALSFKSYEDIELFERAETERAKNSDIEIFKR